MRQFQIELQRHAGRGHTDHIPAIAQNLALQRTLGRTNATVGVEDFDIYAAGSQNSGETPDTKRRCEERIFPTMRIVRTH
jgi:hypothetical protein